MLFVFATSNNFGVAASALPVRGVLQNTGTVKFAKMSGDKYPPAFGHYADSMVGGSYRDKDKLWSGVGHADAKLCTVFRDIKSKSPAIADDIMARLRACQKKSRVGGANRGNRSGAAPSPPRKVTIAKGIPNLHEI